MMTAYEEGCYGDGSFGPDHCTRKVFDIALSEGWPVGGERCILFVDNFPDKDFINGNLSDEDIAMYSIYLQELENEAIDYLNDHCSDDTHYWGYENGDFGYWEIEEMI